MTYFRFLLSYEKYLKNLGPDHIDEMDEKNEKIFEEEEKRNLNGTNGENGDASLEDEDEVSQFDARWQMIFFLRKVLISILKIIFLAVHRQLNR